MTEIQKLNQAEGPHRPTAEELGLILLRKVPSHFEIRALAINGQTGLIIAEVRHDEMEQTLTIRT